ncbi:hypothetical protein B0H17DRAFT_1135710 [Mycena rosella]|uniref:Uncharacterized protein n=1 Tax=Mycena rosella TaxID=1033263 RepID=A0AAD7DCS9_MYCRO|nr:hypothetical protein B0H17DRAFT_1135710 [Mycena rosella]
MRMRNDKLKQRGKWTKRNIPSVRADLNESTGKSSIEGSEGKIEHLVAAHQIVGYAVHSIPRNIVILGNANVPTTEDAILQGIVVEGPWNGHKVLSRDYRVKLPCDHGAALWSKGNTGTSRGGSWAHRLGAGGRGLPGLQRGLRVLLEKVLGKKSMSSTQKAAETN